MNALVCNSIMQELSLLS